MAIPVEHATKRNPSRSLPPHKPKKRNPGARRRAKREGDGLCLLTSPAASPQPRMVTAAGPRRPAAVGGPAGSPPRRLPAPWPPTSLSPWPASPPQPARHSNAPAGFRLACGRWQQMLRDRALARPVHGRPTPGQPLGHPGPSGQPPPSRAQPGLGCGAGCRPTGAHLGEGLLQAGHKRLEDRGDQRVERGCHVPHRQPLRGGVLERALQDVSVAQRGDCGAGVRQRFQQRLPNPAPAGAEPAARSSPGAPGAWI